MISNKPNSGETSQGTLLLWPQSLLLKKNPLSSGFAIGWSETNEGGPTTTFVVGIVPHAVTDASWKGSLQIVQEEVELLRESCCTCCTCRVTQQSLHHPCVGCTRQILFQNLSVVAVFDPDNKLLGQNMDVPRICLVECASRMQRLPWLASPAETPSRNVRRGQLLLYNDRGVIFRHVPCSPFRWDILTKISHASMVMLILRGTLTTTAGKSDSRKTSQVQVTPASRDNKENDISKDPHSLLILDWLQDVSFFSAHLLWHVRRQVSEIPMIRLVQSMAMQQPQPSMEHREVKRCFSCGKRILLQQTRDDSINDAMRCSGERIRIFFDIMMGLAISVSLYQYHTRDSGKHAMNDIFAKFDRWVVDGVKWLESNPIGFKLNAHLTESIGNALRSLMAIRHQVISQIVSNQLCWTANGHFISALVGGILGGSGTLAIAIDFLRLSSFHVYMLAYISRNVYRAELYFLGALWKLFQGKKKNILRHRVDSMENDSMQLLLGTILFAVALFLFTTILAYHLFFGVLDLLILLSLLPLVTAYVVIVNFPFGEVLFRATHTAFVEQMAITTCREADDLSFDVTFLGLVQKSNLSIIRDKFFPITRRLQGFLKISLISLATGSRGGGPLLPIHDDSMLSKER